MRLFGCELSPAELRARIGRLDQIGGITPFTLQDGRGVGVRALRLETGVLCVEIVADRGLDISRVALRGTPLHWRSANDIASPAYYDARGDEWLRSFFGGWLTTCGLGNFGPAGEDRFGSFGLHGRINNIPAEDLAWRTEWHDDGACFEIRGTMRQTRALGERLVLHRTIRAELGGATLRIEDRVVNEGRSTVPHMILYHCNAGWPLLDCETRVIVSQSEMRPRDDDARAGVEVWDRGAPPQAGFREQVFVHTVRATQDGTARAIVANAALGAAGMGFEVAFDPTTLPALISWRKLDVGDYVIAVEPANTPYIEGRVAAGDAGRLPMLEPGEERRYTLALTVLEGERLSASIATAASASATNPATR